MKTLLAAFFFTLSSLTFAETVVYEGPLPYPYDSTSFGYNLAEGKAWVIVKSGTTIYLGDDMTYWNGDEKVISLEGLTLNPETRVISFNGVDCGRIKKPMVRIDKYPFKNYRTCHFVNKSKKVVIEDYRGSRKVIINKVTIEVSE